MKNIFISLLLVCSALHAEVPNPDFQHTFNHLQGVPEARKWSLGTVLRQAHNTAVCVYDFATQGGAIGNIKLLGTDLVTPCLLPGKAVIRGGFVDWTTTLTSGGSATVSISSGQAVADLKAAQAYTALSPQTTFNSTSNSLIPTPGTQTTYVKITAANSIVGGVNTNPSQPYITVATAALTAGHARVFIDYSVSE